MNLKLPRFHLPNRADLERGVTAVEYAILVAVIGVMSIPAISLAGSSLSGIVTTANTAIGGQATDGTADDPNCADSVVQERFHSVFIDMSSLSTGRVEVHDPTWVSDLTACGFSFSMTAEKTFDFYIGWTAQDGAGQTFNGGTDFKGRVSQFVCTWDNGRADGSGIQFDEHCTQLFEPNAAWAASQLSYNWDDDFPGWGITASVSSSRPSEAHPTFRLLKGSETVDEWSNYVWWS